MDERLPKLKDDVQLGLTNYVARLAELLAQCAVECDRDAEAFLWNSRRVLEVVCHILYSIDENRLSQDDGASGDLDSRLKGLRKKGLAPSEVSIALENIRQNCNLGVHVRNPERETYPLALRHVRNKLPDVVDWLLDQSVASHYVARPESLDEALRVIRREGIGSSIRPPVPPHPTSPRTRGARVWPIVFLAAFGLIVAVAVVWAWSRSGPVPWAVANLAGAPVPAGIRAEARVGQACPGGMVRTGASVQQVGRLAEQATAAGASFCIDPAPRTWTQFSAWPLSMEVIVDGCSWRDGERSAPVVCVSRDEAAAYCEWAGGRLPDQMQWAAILRRPEWGAQPGGVREWLRGEPSVDLSVSTRHDPTESALGFASRAFQAMGAEGGEAPWDTLSAKERRKDLGFRCSADPS